jgi:2',3'-cyclic-nucleotide 2'-phosphodiesterase (5'-nucleotidase family)
MTDKIKILITSDLHALLDYNPQSKQPGIARFFTYIQNLKKSYRVLLLDTGDLLSGSVYGAFDRGRTAASLLGRLNYRALLPGNHDFDYCPEENDRGYYFQTLVPLIREHSPDVTVIGLNFSPKPPSMAPGPLIINSNPKIAVIGILNPLTHRPSLGPVLDGYDFGLKKSLAQTKKDILADVLAAIKTLDPDTAVIILSHLGAPNPGRNALAGQMDLDFDHLPSGLDLAGLEGVKAVIDGHSHKVILPYRAFGKALYANLGRGLAAAAEITVQGSDLNLELLLWDKFAALPPDPYLNDQILQLNDKLGLNEVLITLRPDSPYDLDGLWETITPLGQLIAQALSAGAQTQMAFLNKGALRTGLSGVVTLGDLHEVLPFNDRLVSFMISGDNLLNLMRLFGQKGFRGFPLYHGLKIWAYPIVDVNDRAENRVGVAGLTTDQGPVIEGQKLYSLAVSGQMIRLLVRQGLDLGPLTEHGGILDAVAQYIKLRSQKLFLHNPFENPYLFFENKQAADLAFQDN